MRRVTLTMTAAGAAVVMLAGCGGDDPVSQASPGSEPTPTPAVEQAEQDTGDTSSSSQSGDAEGGDGVSGGEDSSSGASSTSGGDGDASGDGDGDASGTGDDASGTGDDASGDDGGASSSAEPTPPPVTDPPTSEEDTAGSSDVPAPRATIRHGGEYWAVLWAEDTTSAPLNDVRQALHDRWGAVWMDGDIGCNDGAADALGTSGDQRAVSVHFDTEAEARRFASEASLGAAPTGHAQVTTYCLD